MSLDPPITPSPTPSQTPSQAPSSSSGKTLATDTDLRLRGDYEKARYKKLRFRIFDHTPAFDFDFLREAGMDTELDLVFQSLGWESFWLIHEQGSRLLTIEFLCTLRETKEGVSFRLFGQKYTPS